MDLDFRDRVKKAQSRRPPVGASLYLHFPCFDGVISAALAAEFLERSLNWTIARYVPVNYDRLKTWHSLEIPADSAVVDFLYHPSPFFWADHHVTSFVNPNDRAAVDQNEGRILLYDDHSPSCAVLLWDHLKSYLDESPRLEQMVLWADKIDSARYETVQEAIFGSSAATDISLSLALRSDQQYCDLLITTLRKDTLEEVAALSEVREAANEVRRRINAGMKEVAEHARLDFGDIAVLKARQTEGSIISRYSPYHFFPDAKYSVSLVQFGDSAKITAMRNPWKNFESIGLGELFKRFGGGGHRRVASAVLPPESGGGAKEILDQIVAAIHEADSKTSVKRRGVSR